MMRGHDGKRAPQATAERNIPPHRYPLFRSSVFNTFP